MNDDLLFQADTKSKVNMNQNYIAVTKSSALITCRRVFDVDTVSPVIPKLYEYTNVIMKGVGMDEFDVVTLGALTNKMFATNRLAFDISENELLDAHSIPVNNRFRYRDKIRASLTNILNTSCQYHHKEKIYNKSYIDEPVYGDNGVFEITMKRSFADSFIDEPMVLNIHKKVLKLITSEDAAFLMIALLTFRFHKHAVNETYLCNIANSLNVSHLETKRKNERIKRAFEFLVKGGYVTNYKNFKKSGMHMVAFTVSDKFDQLAREQQKLDVINNTYYNPSDAIKSGNVTIDNDGVIQDEWPDFFKTSAEKGISFSDENADKRFSFVPDDDSQFE